MTTPVDTEHCVRVQGPPVFRLLSWSTCLVKIFSISWPPSAKICTSEFSTHSWYTYRRIFFLVLKPASSWIERWSIRHHIGAQCSRVRLRLSSFPLWPLACFQLFFEISYFQLFSDPSQTVLKYNGFQFLVSVNGSRSSGSCVPGFSSIRFSGITIFSF